MADQNFSIASEKDDFDLKECLKSIPMAGAISVAFETEPSYFNAISVQGKKQQVVICKDKDQLVGFGTFAVKPVFLNGEVVEVGYLSGLRGYPQYRKGTFLARAYRFIKRLIEENGVPFSLTTLFEDNLVARKILESGRVGLPNYNFFENFSTFLIKPRRKNTNRNIEVVRGSEVSLEEIVRFMNQEGSKKQFYPFYNKKDFSSDYLKDLKQEDFYIAVSGSEIIGLVAKWDQESFKQTRVVDYDRKMSLVRPFINLLSNFSNIPRLPIKGELLHYFYLFSPITKDNNPKIMESLLSAVSSDPENRHYDYFTIGFSESDPLIETARTFNPREYRSRIYLVSFGEKNPTLNLDGRVPYLELATL